MIKQKKLDQADHIHAGVQCDNYNLTASLVLCR